jgi:hypothetical protein
MFYIQIAVVTAAFLALYYPFIMTMVADWDQNDNYSHGYLIPFIVGFMIYSMRDELKSAAVKPASWGLLVIVAGLCQLIVAKIGSEFFLQRTSLIVVLFGLTLFFWGKRVTAKVSIPLIYLLFMVPVPCNRLESGGLSHAVVRLRHHRAHHHHDRHSLSCARATSSTCRKPPWKWSMPVPACGPCCPCLPSAGPLPFSSTCPGLKRSSCFFPPRRLPF